VGVALGIALFDLVTDTAVGVGFLGIAPLVAAARGARPPQVAWLVALTTGLVIVLGVPDGIFGELLHVVLVLGVLSTGVLSVYVSHLRAQRDEDQVRLEMQYGVAATLQECQTLEEAAPRLLEAVGRPLEWQFGGLWAIRPSGSLQCVASWSVPGVDASEFYEASRAIVMRRGMGMPGRVWERGEAISLEDLTLDPSLPRSQIAIDAGVKGGVAFPLLTSSGVMGVIEFFAHEERTVDGDLLELLRAVGGQVGEFVEAQSAEEALRASEARKAAILESALDCVITMDHEGRIVEFNPSAEETFGIPARDAIGREMAELIIPAHLREAHRAGLARYLETGEGKIVGRRVEVQGRRSDGTEFPVELAVSLIPGQVPPMFTGYLRDITRRRQADEERERLLELERVARLDADRARVQLSAILRGIADGVTAQAPDGKLIFANETAVSALGFASVEELVSTPPEVIRDRFEMWAEDGKPFPAAELPGRRALMGEEGVEAVIRHVDRRDGAERWNRVKATPIFDDSGEVVMAINVMEDVTDLKRTEQSQRLLAEAGKVIASSMDSERILQRISDLMVVPWLADWCSVHMPDEEGGIVMAAHASSRPDSAHHILELERRFPALPGATRGVPHILETGQTELYPDITPQMMEAEARSPEHLALMRRAGPYSALLAPLVTRGKVLGVLGLLRLGEGRRYDQEDVTMVEELGRRVGIAVDNARLYEERSYIAKTLQASLLPAELPDIPGVETGARFRATGEGNDVGGDFYDLFEAGGGGWSVVVGDVCGKGPDAAAVTALARYTLRAAAMREPRPSAGLRILNEALLRQRSDLRFATVAYASLRPESGGARVQLASAGHPLPLVLRSDGSVEPVGSAGTLVGVVPDPDLDDASAYLSAGDALVFYTDGVTEARDEEGGIMGERRLESLLRSCAGMDADGIAAAVERAAVERQNGDTRDDIAVVVLRSVGGRSHHVAGEPKRGTSQDVSSTGPDVVDQMQTTRTTEPGPLTAMSGRSGFRMRIGGGPRAAGRARTELSRLRADLDAPLLETVRLLVTELVTNSVRHAGAAAVDLAVLVARDRVRVEIANPGTTFEPEQRDSNQVTEGGWGLFLVERLSDDWGVTSDAGGYQRVWFDIRRA
jgi:PAS domain S-box-containing protein